MLPPFSSQILLLLAEFHDFHGGSLGVSTDVQTACCSCHLEGYEEGSERLRSSLPNLLEKQV